jgi:hypothetical protein
MKRKITIEKLLEWAFREELCKVGAGGGQVSLGYASAGSSFNDVVELGTLIDRTPNTFGVIADFISTDDPHPDALKVGRAVKALAKLEIEFPASWNPLAEFDDPHGLIEDEIARFTSRADWRADMWSGAAMVSLVTRVALLGRGPDWRIDGDIGFRLVMMGGKPAWFIKTTVGAKDGRPYQIETADGYDRRKHRPKAGAYRKFELKRSILVDIQARAEWQLWQDALLHLRNGLVDAVEAFEIAEFHPVRIPWMRKAKADDRELVIENIEK